MNHKYSAEKNVQMLISILKANGIRKAVVSPGTTNLNLITSMQYDGSFEMYSCPDERSAAYIACGLSEESGEPVVITCTGATASREYLSGLSEAYYRKLPILAVTASQMNSNAYNLSPQFVDNTSFPKDSVKISVQLQDIKDKNDEWDCNVKINRAVQELFRHGKGPVHINLTTNYNNDLSVEVLPETRVIKRYSTLDTFPKLPDLERIAISVGAHHTFSEELKKEIEKFCENYNSVVLIDHSSDYDGKYAILPTILASQEGYQGNLFNVDLLIHIGEQSGDYYTYNRLMSSREVWRISEDGEIRDTFHHLTNMFEMTEIEFFKHYNNQKVCNEETEITDTSYFNELNNEVQKLYDILPELPLSNVYAASKILPGLPRDSVIHFGVSNTMRSWTFFERSAAVKSKANVGCRGIDGAISAMVGASLANPQKLHFLVLGDLTFFYDFNVLGNRHIGKNIRILLINNGVGAEFHIYHHRAQILLGNDSDEYVAAAGHYGNKSPDLVKHYSEDLGFEYLFASTKEEFERSAERFLTSDITDKPMIFEVFTNPDDESAAVHAMRTIIVRPNAAAKDAVKKIIGDRGVKALKKVMRK